MSRQAAGTSYAGTLTAEKDHFLGQSCQQCPGLVGGPSLYTLPWFVSSRAGDRIQTMLGMVTYTLMKPGPC